jgi:dephospho-CoA kinase
LADAKLHSLRSAGHPLIVYEAPLLFEASAESRVDQVLVVTVDPEIQIDRLVKRDGISRDEALARIEAQMPLAEKISRADYVIDNSDAVVDTKAQAEKLYHYLLQFSPQ